MRFIIVLLLVGSLSSSYGSSHGNRQSKNGANSSNYTDAFNELSDIETLYSTSSSSDTEVRVNLNFIEGNLVAWIKMGRMNFIPNNKETLQLLEDEELGRSRSLVWTGIYTNIEKEIVNQTVAVKIFSRKKDFNVEFAVFHALNAETDPNIEQYGIPRVYYRGPMLNSFYCIVMTMFDDNLEEYYDDKENNITDITMLSFFKQAVVGLKYLNGRNIVHNDIKPQNLFLRGQKLFISDFDLSTLNGAQNRGRTYAFASARFYRNQNRYPMDDLESLVYSMWWISGVEMIRYYIPHLKMTEGSIMSKCNKEEAIDRVLEKLKHYQNPHVYEVMKYICVDEMLSDRPVPFYDLIIAKLNKAILDGQK